MKYSRFEDLPVWQAAITLKLDVDSLCQHDQVRARRNWIDQIDRASYSVSNNIAEGFERGTTNELLMFLYIARGSVGEVRSMLHYLGRSISSISMNSPRAASEISNLKSQISNLISQCKSNSLQNTEIKGPRHLTDQNRQAYHNRKQAEAFWQQNRQAVAAQQERRLREQREAHERQQDQQGDNA